MKPNTRILLSAAAGVLVAAAVAVPLALASSGGGSSPEVASAPAPAIGELPLPPPLNGDARRQLDEFTDCLHEHGIELPDEDTGQGSLMVVPAPDDPKLRDAIDACGGPPPSPPPPDFGGERGALAKAMADCLPGRRR
jgi:hypothetical protein